MGTITTSKPAMPVVDGVEHTMLALADGRMHVATMGSGDPVLLLSGYAQTWWEFRDLMPVLARAGYRAIAPDLRGEGWSELPAGDITRTRRAEDVLALLDALGLHRVRLVSHDASAITAYQLALEFPDRISAQVVFAVPPPQMRFSFDLIPGMRHLWHQEVLAVPGLGPALLRSGRLPRNLYARFAKRPLDPDDVARYVALLRDPHVLQSAGPLCRRMVLPEVGRLLRGVYRQARFAMPSLFVFGTADISFPAPVIRRLFADPLAIGADARLGLVEGAGHYIIDEDPDAAAALVLEFFAAA